MGAIPRVLGHPPPRGVYSGRPRRRGLPCCATPEYWGPRLRCGRTRPRPSRAGYMAPGLATCWAGPPQSTGDPGLARALRSPCANAHAPLRWHPCHRPRGKAPGVRARRACGNIRPPGSGATPPARRFAAASRRPRGKHPRQRLRPAGSLVLRTGPPAARSRALKPTRAPRVCDHGFEASGPDRAYPAH